MSYYIKNKNWQYDEYGWYWTGDLYSNNKRVGGIGNYYDIDKGRQRTLTFKELVSLWLYLLRSIANA